MQWGMKQEFMHRDLDENRGGGNMIPVPTSHEWSFDTLRMYLESKITGNDQRYAERFTAQEKTILDKATVLEKAVIDKAQVLEKAVDKAEVTTNDKFHSMNEFRQLINDMIVTLMTRKEFEGHIATFVINHTNLENLVANNTSRLDKMSGNYSGKNEGWSTIQSTISVISAIVMAIAAGFMVFHH